MAKTKTLGFSASGGLRRVRQRALTWACLGRAGRCNHGAEISQQLRDLHRKLMSEYAENSQEENQTTSDGVCIEEPIDSSPNERSDREYAFEHIVFWKIGMCI